ncbi:MAG: GNAT family N-acetyltransferase [bacterium]
MTSPRDALGDSLHGVDGVSVLVWRQRAFDALTARELYAILAQRAEVFVVEQRCAYQDLDGFDAASTHLWAERADGTIVACLRVLPAGVKYDEVSIGRVVTAPSVRRTGLGRELMRRGIIAAGERVPIRIGAQAYLECFYGEFGFERASELYDEDGIPHIEMLRRGS